MKVTIDANLHPAQLQVHNCEARFRVLCAGRKFGKTRLGVMEGLGAAAKGKRGWWLAPAYKPAEVGWRPLYSMAGKIPGAIRNKSDKTVVLPGGGWISVRSADSGQGLRSEGLDFVIIDEAAFIDPNIWSQQIRPNLTATQGWALFISTPWGLNWFHDLYRKGESYEPDWASFHYPTSANPYIAPEEIEAARRDLPELIFQQEYLANFVSLEGSVFRRIQEAAVLEQIEQPVEGRQYVASVDPAASIDYTVVCIWDVAASQCVYFDRFNRVDYTVLEDRLAAVYNRFHCQSMAIEANSIGQGVIDHLVNRDMAIIPFTTTSATKQTIITQLQAAFEHSEIKIVNNSIAVGELLSFEARRSPSGNYQYSAPDGMHDDYVMSLAIGWHAIARPSAIDLIAML